MRVLWLVNQPWFCASKLMENSRVFWIIILYKIKRPQVSIVYRLINHLGCWKNNRRIQKSLACGSAWFTTSNIPRGLSAFFIQLAYTVRIPIFWLVDFYHVTLSCDETTFLTSLSWFIIWLCLTKTGNYQIHEVDWLKWILTAVQIFPSRPATRPIMFWSEKVAT